MTALGRLEADPPPHCRIIMNTTTWIHIVDEPLAEGAVKGGYAFACTFI